MTQWLNQYNVLAFDSIDSTNDEAKRLIKSGILSGMVVWSKEQTDGRGRHGRSWESLDGNLYMSILTSIDCSLDIASQLSFVIGLAAYNAVSKIVSEYDKHPTKLCSLKWPNDLMLGDYKIGGILLESLPQESKSSIIIGLGLNLRHFPLNIPNTTSLNEYSIDIPPSYMLNAIMDSFISYHAIWKNSGFAAIRKEWLEYAYKLGQVITVNNDTNRISGTFESIDSQGAITLKLSSGKLYSLSTGEVFF